MTAPNTLPLHPAHAAKIAQRQAIKAAQDREDSILSEFAKVANVRVLHLNPYTLAYSTPKDAGRDVIYVSTALCNPKDSYSKKEGRRVALQAHGHGEVIMLRKPRGMNTAEFLASVFNIAQFLASTPSIRSV